MRAALEGIAFQVRDVLDAAGAAGHVAVRVDGGATANPVLMQFQADILQRPVEVAAEREATGIGAAGLACLGAGLWSGPEPARELQRDERALRAGDLGRPGGRAAWRLARGGRACPLAAFIERMRSAGP